MTLITLGILSVAFTLGSFVQFLTEAEIPGLFWSPADDETDRDC